MDRAAPDSTKSTGRFSFGVYKRQNGDGRPGTRSFALADTPSNGSSTPRSRALVTSTVTSPAGSHSPDEWNSQEVPSVSGLVSASGHALPGMESMGIEDYIPDVTPPSVSGAARRSATGTPRGVYGPQDSFASDISMATTSEISSVIDMAGGDRSRVVAKTLARALADKPDLALPSYGENWELAPFLILHNAIRRELMDLYTIMWSLERRTNIDAGKEMEEVLEWWGDFRTYCTQIFEVETKGVFRGLLNTFGDRDDPLTPVNKKLQRMQGEIVEQFREIDPSIKEFAHRPDQTNYDVMVLRLDFFTKSCTTYFAEMESIMEAHILKRYVPADMQALERTMVKMMVNCFGRQFLETAYVLLSRWMEPATRDKWISEQLDKRSQKLYVKWWKSFYEGHGKVATVFRKRVKYDLKPASYAPPRKYGR